MLSLRVRFCVCIEFVLLLFKRLLKLDECISFIENDCFISGTKLVSIISHDRIVTGPLQKIRFNVFLQIPPVIT